MVLAAFTIQPISTIGNIDNQKIRANINTNIFSQINMLQQYVQYAEKEGKNIKIISLDSGAAYSPLKGWSMYCCGKAYMSMFLKCLMLEKKCSVVLYDPGVVDTDMQAYIRTAREDVFDRVEEFREYQSSGKLHSVQEVAENIYERYIVSWNPKSIMERFC